MSIDHFNSSLSPKVHFLTFSNSEYVSPQRILQQANTSKFFANSQAYSELDVKELIKRHKKYFKATSKDGFGHFMWKPYIILKMLEQIPNGEFLIYSDLGTHINYNVSAKAKFNAYLNRMLNDNSTFGVFQTSKAYNAQGLVTLPVIKSYFPQFAFFKSWIYCYAGVIFIYNCPESKKAMEDWMMLCEKYLPKAYFGLRRKFISDLKWIDADAGLLNIVLAKHGRCSFFDGHDVNLYSADGTQLKHKLTPEQYKNLDWSALQNSPFVIKRDR